MPADATNEHGWDLLGALRFAMALIVVAVHVQQFTNPNSIWTALSRFGALPAILCFLVVSGYSIAHSITRQREGFYIRRFRRIYPLYLIAVLAALIPEALQTRLDAHSIKTLVANLLFLQTFRTNPVPGNPVVWTLAVEAACYAIAPALVRLRTSWLLGLAGISAVAYAAYGASRLAYYAELLHGLPLLFLAWAWLMGFICHRISDHWAAGIGSITGAVILATLNSKYMEPWSMVTLVGGIAVVICNQRVTLPQAIRPTLRFLGDLSYPLYLFHAPLLLVYHDVYHRQSQWFVVIGSLLLAAMMLRLDATIGRPVTEAARFVVSRLKRHAALAARILQPRLATARSPGSDRLAARATDIKDKLLPYLCIPQTPYPRRPGASG